MNDPGLILLTGATGYVGGRLRAALEAEGRPLRCMASPATSWILHRFRRHSPAGGP